MNKLLKKKITGYPKDLQSDKGEGKSNKPSTCSDQTIRAEGQSWRLGTHQYGDIYAKQPGGDTCGSDWASQQAVSGML